MWLPEKVSSLNNVDETLTNFDFMQNICEANCNVQSLETENEENFLRCVYILQGCTGNEGYDYLLQVIIIEHKNDLRFYVTYYCLNRLHFLETRLTQPCTSYGPQNASCLPQIHQSLSSLMTFTGEEMTLKFKTI